MIPMSVAQVAEAVAGRVVDCPDPSVPVLGAAADSRLVGAGDLFVAIAGERADGHDFADRAVAAGAAAVLAARPVGVPAIVVEDPIAALGRLAAHVRAALVHLRVVGITGSSGKTTTKDLLAQLLPSLGPTVAPEGSFNTEVGLPLTVLRADEGTRFLALEMGMRGHGHIRYLAGIARPTIGLVINVGSAHMELLGSREQIALAKAELVDSLTADGLAVLNADDDLVAGMAARCPSPVVWFGTSARCQVRATDVRMGPRARPEFTLQHGGTAAPVRLRLSGEHMVSNALGAAAVALSLGMPLDLVAEVLSVAEPKSRWRMEVHETPSGVTVINDAYNANPQSMGAALRALASMAAGRRSWAVIGEMRELGATSAQEHAGIGELAASLGIDRVIAVGDGARPVEVAATAAGVRATWVAQAHEAADLVAGEARRDDVILIKASRAVGLESVAEAILGVHAGGSAPRDGQ